MLIDVSVPILDYQNEPVTKNEAEEPFLVGDALLQAANAGGKQDEDGKTKFTRFRLAMRVADALEAGESVSLVASEVVLLKESVAQIYTPLVVGRVWEVLDPEDKPDTE